MIRFRAEQEIARSASDVWTYAADMTRHPEWMGVADAQVVRGDPREIGAMGRETVKMGARRFTAEFVVSESAPGRHIAWRIAGGMPLVGEARLDLEPVGPECTRATWSGAFRMTGLWQLLEPMMAGEIRAGEAAELERLKGVLETPMPVIPATA